MRKNMRETNMSQHFLIAALVLLVSPPTFADETLKWNPGVFLNSSSEQITMLFGPPSTVKTERKFAEFVKDKNSGCGNISVYGFSWLAGTAGDLVLTGPLGPASSVEMWFENDRSFSVKWEYEGNQHEDAMERWSTSKEMPLQQGKKPSVINLGIWKPKKDTSVFVHCYSGGDSRSCKGTITAEYMFDNEK
jgi:rhodanese-related sulfurtransferase